MKKKMFKRAGVAVLSMAMLLSMGAVGAISASAATTIGVAVSDTGLVAGDTFTVYKVAGINTATGQWQWLNSATIDGLPDIAALSSTYGADNTKTLASLLERNTSKFTTTYTGTVSADGKTGVATLADEDGYYLVVVTPSKNNTKMIQPILQQVKNGETITVTSVKTAEITMSKEITSVDKNGTYNHSATISDRDTAQAEFGATVGYKLTTQIPDYDNNLDKAVMTSYTITDKPEDTIVIDFDDNDSNGKGIAVKVNNAVVNASATIDTDAADETFTVTKKSDFGTGFGTGFVITFDKDYILANPNQTVTVEFTAKVGKTESGARVIDVGTDANINDATVTFGNDYSTGGGSKSLSDGADVYSTSLTLTKYKEDGSTAFANVGFKLYNATESGGVYTKGAEVMSGTTDANGQIEFKGLDAGTYYLEEQSGTANAAYQLVSKGFTIGNTSADQNFSVANGDITLENTNKVFSTSITDPLRNSLPGTGGMGTVMFTVGGAAIVLCAGFMFVIYMRKRRAEEE